MKKIMTVVAAALAISMFTACEFKVDYKGANAVGKKESTVTLSKDNVKNGGYGDVSVVDGAIVFKAAGNYAVANIDVSKEALDLSKSKVTIEISGEGVADCNDEYGDIKFAFSTTPDLGSEVPARTLKTSSKEMAVKDGEVLKAEITPDMLAGAIWSADNHIKPAYLGYIQTITINPQKVVGTLKIKSIKVSEIK